MVNYSVRNVLIEVCSGMLEKERKGSMQTRSERRMNMWTPKIFCI